MLDMKIAAAAVCPYATQTVCNLSEHVKRRRVTVCHQTVTVNGFFLPQDLPSSVNFTIAAVSHSDHSSIKRSSSKME